jgi:hypothetical protein
MRQPEKTGERRSPRRKQDFLRHGFGFALKRAKVQSPSCRSARQATLRDRLSYDRR